MANEQPILGYVDANIPIYIFNSNSYKYLNLSDVSCVEIPQGSIIYYEKNYFRIFRRNLNPSEWTYRQNFIDECNDDPSKVQVTLIAPKNYRIIVGIHRSIEINIYNTHEYYLYHDKTKTRYNFVTSVHSIKIKLVHNFEYF